MNSGEVLAGRRSLSDFERLMICRFLDFSTHERLFLEHNNLVNHFPTRKAGVERVLSKLVRQKILDRYRYDDFIVKYTLNHTCYQKFLQLKEKYSMETNKLKSFRNYLDRCLIEKSQSKLSDVSWDLLLYLLPCSPNDNRILTFAHLASKTQIPRSTVARRIQQMVNQGILIEVDRKNKERHFRLSGNLQSVFLNWESFDDLDVKTPKLSQTNFEYEVFCFELENQRNSLISMLQQASSIQQNLTNLLVQNDILLKRLKSYDTSVVKQV